MTPPEHVLETILYAEDLEAARDFYRDVLGLDIQSQKLPRQVFFRCGTQMLLIFNPLVTRKPPGEDDLPIPTHGSQGPGHVCFSASAGEIEVWRDRLAEAGVAIESDFEWPQGGRSIYFRDPAGNSIEFAEPRIWGLEP